MNNMVHYIFLKAFLRQICFFEKEVSAGNYATFMTKEVRKAIIIKSKLRNIFLKYKNEQSRNDYQKQRNLCVAFSRRTIQQYFSRLDLSLFAYKKKI